MEGCGRRERERARGRVTEEGEQREVATWERVGGPGER